MNGRECECKIDVEINRTELTENDEPSGNATYRLRRDSTFATLSVPFTVAVFDPFEVNWPVATISFDF